ncbi:hypothetical protein MMC09_001120 [Bachmanniomyces sp. S44760]|nr:hypothetical protein [Bachmanniomyces sp. S44760]
MLFISKADSTGYLHLLKLPKTNASPLKTVVSTFLKYFLERGHREGVRSVISLFARAQNQYLFPGSIENSGKHVLDDRGLIKWWCKVLDPVLVQFSGGQKFKSPGRSVIDTITSQGYLRVPGCDLHETRSFFPSYVKSEPPNKWRWKPQDPLSDLDKPSNTPERCLIPRFPDDPKARYMVDLDDELPDSSSQIQSHSNGSQQQARNDGKWRSVRSLEEFWEMMSFRQECSAGRLVGFIWGVFTPTKLLSCQLSDGIGVDQTSEVDPLSHSALTSQAQADGSLRPRSPSHPSPPAMNDLFPTPLPSSQSQSQSQSQAKILMQTLPTQASASSPTSAVSLPQPFPLTRDIQTLDQGQLTLPEPLYQRALDHLLTLDYANEEIARQSTKSYISFVQELASEATDSASRAVDPSIFEAWGQVVVGTSKATDTKDGKMDVGLANESSSSPSVLGSGLVRKKPKRPVPETSEAEDKADIEGGGDDDGVVTLAAAGLIGKKQKIAES